MDNEPQPDCLLFIEPRCGGAVKIVDGDIEGAPDLVAEVSASSVSIDLNAKFRAYRQNQVREYLVWRVNDHAIDWFVLRGEQFARIQPDADGILKSEVFPGLWLNVAGMLNDDVQEVWATLREGVADESHRQFVERLAETGKPR
jgi:Uma2 family endonuclease